jgi:MFS family permease
MSGTPLTSATEANSLLSRLERLPRLTFHVRLTALLGGGLLLDGLDTVIIAIVLTAIMATFRVNQASAGFLIGAGYFGQAVGAPIIGSLAEHYGRKKLYLFSLLSMGLGSLLAAIAPTITWLFVARLWQGIALGGCAPVAIALLTEFLPGTKRGRSTSLAQALYALGFVLAPVLALVLFPLVGPLLVWRIFFAIGALPMVIAALAAWFVPESVRWQVVHGRYEEASTTISRLEHETRHEYGAVPLPENAADLLPSFTIQSQTRLREMFAPAYRQRTLLIWVQWFAAAFLLVGFSSWLPTLYVQQAGSIVVKKRGKEERSVVMNQRTYAGMIWDDAWHRIEANGHFLNLTPTQYRILHVFTEDITPRLLFSDTIALLSYRSNRKLEAETGISRKLLVKHISNINARALSLGLQLCSFHEGYILTLSSSSVQKVQPFGQERNIQ